MRETLDLLRHERRARVFFLTLLQSSIGTGGGYVALLVIAYQRFESPWAISLVLIADLLPSMLFGPVFGALADRWSRKSCAVLADVLRVVAFAGVALVDDFTATVLFAVVAGIGNGLFAPAVLAALPSVVDEPRRVPAATALYGVVGDLGFMVGPAIAAALLVIGGPETVMGVNSASFAVSAVLLAGLRFGSAPERPEEVSRSLLTEARDGMRATAGMRDIRIVLLGSAAVLVCAGLFNVAELLFVTEELNASSAGFSLLVAFFGVGFIAGSLVGSTGGAAPLLKRRYLIGLFSVAASLLVTGVATSVVVAALTFTFSGFGNGLLLVYERLLIQATVPDSLVGRVFGIKDALTAWAFGLAFLTGGALVAGLGTRELILAAGGVALLVYAVSAIALRNQWLPGGPPEEAVPDRVSVG